VVRHQERTLLHNLVPLVTFHATGAAIGLDQRHANVLYSAEAHCLHVKSSEHGEICCLAAVGVLTAAYVHPPPIRRPVPHLPLAELPTTRQHVASGAGRDVGGVWVMRSPHRVQCLLLQAVVLLLVVEHLDTRRHARSARLLACLERLGRGSKLHVPEAARSLELPHHAHMTTPPPKTPAPGRHARRGVAGAKRHQGEDRMVEHRPDHQRPVILCYRKGGCVSAQAHAGLELVPTYPRGGQGGSKRLGVDAGRTARRRGKEQRVLRAPKA